MSSPGVAAAEPSPVEAAREAYEHTRRLLFPFRFERWLTLGFVAFLDQCGRGGVGGVLPGGPRGAFPPSAFGGGGGGGGGSEVGTWFFAHLAIVLAVAAVALILIVVVAAVTLWLGSRATFVYIDDVATGRAELSRPWAAHAAQAQSYFAWRFGLAAALLASLVLLVVGAVSAVVLVARGGSAGAVAGLLLLIVLVPGFLIVLVGGGLAALALRDFVAPIQMHSHVSCGDAVHLTVALVKRYPGPLFLYLVLKIVFGVAQGVLILTGACLTLCCILIPVVTQTVLQPLFFFERAWSLYLLRQMGYDLLTGETRPAPASELA
jgi:hypothetical protein